MEPLSAGIVALIVIVFLAGVALYSATATVTVGSNNDSGECTDLCNQWDARRQERCNAEAEEQSARANVSSLEWEFGLALLAAAAFTAAGIAALAGVFTAVTAVGFFIAAGIAAAAADFLLGMLLSANNDVTAKRDVASRARQAELEARGLLTGSCSPDAAASCFARPSPC